MATEAGSKRFPTWIWVLMLGVFVLELFTYTWCRVKCTHLGYELVQAVERHAKLKRMENRLQTELASLTAPERINAQAGRLLGLRPPKPEQIVALP